MTVAQITVDNVAEYLRLSEVSEQDRAYLESLLTIAKQYIKDYTGQDEAFVNASQTFVAVVYVLCEDMYDNRTLYNATSSTSFQYNQLVKSILDMHSVNLV